MKPAVLNILAAAAALALAGLLLFHWRRGEEAAPLRAREPLAQEEASAHVGAKANPVTLGKLTPGPGAPAADLPGDWPCFRGPARDGIAPAGAKLARSWPADGPPVLWSVPLGDGYAGPAVRAGRVFLLDYDADAQADTLRCLSLADGREIWRYAYPVKIKRNHGISRTVPAVTDRHLVTLGPLCHVACFDPATGALRWARDLAAEFGTTVPEWYAGQCPLIDGDRLILGTGGKALLVALDLETGNVVWQSSNPRQWKMTHVSVVAATIEGVRQYIYCGSGGVAGVDAQSGQILWESTDWRISIATIATPVPVPAPEPAPKGSDQTCDGRIFFAGGYGAGSLMMRVGRAEGGAWEARTLFKLAPAVFGATQQTPILHEGQILGVRPDGRLASLSLEGKSVWDSGQGTNWGLGPWLVADGLVLVMDDVGRLTLAEAGAGAYKPLAKAKVLSGPESWGPMALAGTRLLARDLRRLVCLELGAKGSPAAQ